MNAAWRMDASVPTWFIECRINYGVSRTVVVKAKVLKYCVSLR